MSITFSQQGPLILASALCSGPTMAQVRASRSTASQRIFAPPSGVALASRVTSPAEIQGRTASGFGSARVKRTILNSCGHPGSWTGSQAPFRPRNGQVPTQINVRALFGRGWGHWGVTTRHGSGPVVTIGIGPARHPLRGSGGASGGEPPQFAPPRRLIAVPIVATLDTHRGRGWRAGQSDVGCPPRWKFDHLNSSMCPWTRARNRPNCR
jgi:hypothetical protein